MPKEIRFGGRSFGVASEMMNDDTLSALLGKLSWKYVKTEAKFKPPAVDYPQDELRGDMAHWAGRVWFHSHEMPTFAALRAFDLMSLEGEFREYIRTHGHGVFQEGLTVDEIWASQELFSAAPMVAVIAKKYSSLLTKRVDPTHLVSASEIVFTLGAICFEMPEILADIGFNVLVTDGRIGHTIYIKGINGIDFQHPRGTRVRAGWFSFHDPWPARSLLATERNFNGVRVLEDVTRPPLWLISPEDLAKIVVGYILPIDALPSFGVIFRIVDAEIRVHTRSDRPLWIDVRSEDPEQAFRTLFDLNKGIAPTTAEGLAALGRVRLLMGNLKEALVCFEGALNLGLPGAAQLAAKSLEAAGHHSLARQWSTR